jgi:hypothetical protein
MPQNRSKMIAVTMVIFSIPAELGIVFAANGEVLNEPESVQLL